jgi:hypothetical protein
MGVFDATPEGPGAESIMAKMKASTAAMVRKAIKWTVEFEQRREKNLRARIDQKIELILERAEREAQQADSPAEAERVRAEAERRVKAIRLWYARRQRGRRKLSARLQRQVERGRGCRLCGEKPANALLRMHSFQTGEPWPKEGKLIRHAAIELCTRCVADLVHELVVKPGMDRAKKCDVLALIKQRAAERTARTPSLLPEPPAAAPVPPPASDGGVGVPPVGDVETQAKPPKPKRGRKQRG